MCTLVVLIGGGSGRRIVRLAQEHADFDPAGRRVVSSDSPAFRGRSSSNCAAAALMVNVEGVVCAVLDLRQAMTEAWIEDAYVRAKRGRGNASFGVTVKGEPAQFRPNDGSARPDVLQMLSGMSQQITEIE